ncbi:hypothetical protein FBU30_006810 [Linnemannia zychae]|nr:hypothetical protein FBU30_006810 [Linnemannia zychae]
MARISKKEKQWQFVGNEVRNVDDLTIDYIRAVFGLGPSNDARGGGTILNSSSANERANNVFPYCGNRYKDNAPDTPSPLKGGKIGQGCSIARCKDGNPHCLNYMGQEQWEEDDAFEKYFAKTVTKTDPELSKRKPNYPAGMKNLGATCYANSLLQVWFHDLSFRDVIYRSRFRIDTDKAHDSLYQLQHLFAQLDYGTKDIYNPLSLVSSLKLDTNIQQDAQEFCNLFMARIDDQLQFQEEEYLRSYIKNQFQGHYSYITTCKKCQKSSVRDCTFYELMLNIKENCTLMDCLEEFVEAEDLVGSDRYFCSCCQSLQDATRMIKLERLPKVLNIQLMRFVYDTTSWTRKKSKDIIRFPATIDFSELLQSQSEVLYDLSAVLVHSGPSVHSGHFMAHVLDQSSSKWFVLNDEEVTEFDSTRFDPEDLSDVGSNSKTKKVTMNTKASDAERLLSTFSSRNAYMLTYTRRISGSLTTSSIPPSWILDLVTADNAIFESELNEFTQFKEKVRAKFDQDRTSRQRLYKCWDVASDESDSCYVSAAALSKYMQIDGGGATVDKLQTENSTLLNLDNSAIMCEHQKLCPNSISKSKRISMDARQQLIDQEKLYGLKHKLDLEEFDKLANPKRKASPPAFWISKSWLMTWKKVLPEFHRPYTSTNADPAPLSEPYLFDVYCQHSNLTIDRSHRKILNMSCYKKLIDIFGPMKLPEYEAQECEDCLALQTPVLDDIAKEMLAAAASEKEEFSKIKMRGVLDALQPGDVCYVVSEDFIRRWQSFIKDPISNERPIMIDNSPLLCKHDLFLYDLGNPADKNHKNDIAIVSKEDWQHLQNIYSGGPEITITKQESMEIEDNTIHNTIHTTLGSTIQSNPVHCPDCRNERVLDFSTTTLIVRVYEPGKSAINEDAGVRCTNIDIPPDTTSTKYETSSTATNPKSKRKQTLATHATGIRQSKRIKESKNPYKEIRIQNISKEDTVMVLKMKIMEKTDIVPLYQKLLFGMVELEENEKTVADLAIPPEAVLNLLTFEQDGDALDFDTFHGKSNIHYWKKMHRFRIDYYLN